MCFIMNYRNLSSTMHLIIQLCVIVVNVNSLFGLSGDNICNTTETYSVSTMVKSNIPVKVRSSGWCIAIPPRCSQYVTMMREVWKEQVEEKTRQILTCCEGYYESQELCVRNCSVEIPNSPKDTSCEAELTKNKVIQTSDVKQNTTEKNNISTIIKNISIALQNTITINNHVMVIPKLSDSENDSKNRTFTEESPAEGTYASEDKETMSSQENAYDSNDIDKKINANSTTKFKIDRTEIHNFSILNNNIEKLSMAKSIKASDTKATFENDAINYTPLGIGSALAVGSIILAIVIAWIVRIRKADGASSSGDETSVLRKKESSKKNRADNEVIKARYTYKRSSDLASTSSGAITFQNPIFSSMTEAIRSNRIFACSTCARIVYVDEKGGVKNIINQEHVCPCQSRTANPLRENRQFCISQQQLPKPPLELPYVAIEHASNPDEDSTYETPVHYENIEKTAEPLYAEIKPQDA